MSDHLPYEIQLEIVKRLPVKSLIQFRSVSKTWKSLIASSRFIAEYSGRPTQLQHLLISYEDPIGDQKFVSIADDDTFPQKKVALTVPMSLNILNSPRLVGSSHGLLCLYDDLPDGRDDAVVLWNISIRKAVAVVMPEVKYEAFTIVIGFGVCRETAEPKIVKMIRNCPLRHKESICFYPWEVEVFTLSTGVWKSYTESTNLPRTSIIFGSDYSEQEVLDGFHYWLAVDMITVDD